MELKAFEGQNRNELSMIEVAEAILNERGNKQIMDFNDLYNEVCQYLGYQDEAAKAAMAQFYTDLNIDGRFISLGDNRWGLRSWYPVDSIDEEVSHTDDEQPRRKRNKKVNVFMDNDENAIDYSNDDPEDSDLADQQDELYDEENDDNEEMSDLSSMDNHSHDNIEDDLTIINHDDINREDDEY